MNIGVEYRTTERFYGKPVYVRELSIGYLTTGSHTIAHGIENVYVPRDVTLFNNGSSVVTDCTGITEVYMDRTNLQITTGNNFGSIAAVLKYTKTTD